MAAIVALVAAAVALVTMASLTARPRPSAVHGDVVAAGSGQGSGLPEDIAADAAAEGVPPSPSTPVPNPSPAPPAATPTVGPTGSTPPTAEPGSTTPAAPPEPTESAPTGDVVATPDDDPQQAAEARAHRRQARQARLAHAAQQEAADLEERARVAERRREQAAALAEADDDEREELAEEFDDQRRREARTLAMQDAQRRLAALGYYIGEIDGIAGPATEAATMAFQKVNGLERDGVIGPQTRRALLEPVAPPLKGGPDDRIEVDLTLQVVHLVVDGERVRTMPASSGNGELYLASSGRMVPALTPTGQFEIQSRMEGVRWAALGQLHDPLYFHRGFAIHGSPHVPAHEASHGCVRLSIADNLWLAGQVPDGTTVILHGGTNVYAPPAGRTPGDDPAEVAPGWDEAVALAVDEGAGEPATE